jgi:hypothetical protein
LLTRNYTYFNWWFIYNHFVNIDIDDKVARLLAERHFSKDPANDWAIKCLEDGYDSRSLRMLASMSPMNSPSEYDDRLRLALEELDWANIPPYVYLMRYARILAEGIVADKSDPIEGSREIYKILQATDGHSELGAWYDIDEMISAEHHFTKTGETTYYYREKEPLISDIKQACSDFLRRSKSSIGDLRETSFEEAEAIFRKFLEDNEVSSDIKWIFREDVIIEGLSVAIRTALPDDNRDRAQKCFELGKKRDFGIAFHAFCTLEGNPCCYVQLPENDLDAQYKLMDHRYIKFSCRIGMPEAIAVGNNIMWKIRQLFVNKANSIGFDMIPSNATLLPIDY